MTAIVVTERKGKPREIGMDGQSRSYGEWSWCRHLPMWVCGGEEKGRGGEEVYTYGQDWAASFWEGGLRQQA